jgi:hypothetical protein
MMLKKSFLALVCALLIFALRFNVKAHSSDEVVAVYGKTPTIDGVISPGEYSDANTVTYQGTSGSIEELYLVTVYVKQDGKNLYIAFDIPDTTWMWTQMQGEDEYELVVYEPDFSWVLLDLEHDGGTVPQTDDLALLVSRWGGQMEGHGNPSSIDWWESHIWVTPNGWTAASFNNQYCGFQTEYSIPYSKIGITAGVAKTLGVAFMNEDSNFEMTWFSAWPPSEWGESDYEVRAKPDVWGDLTSGAPYFWIPEPPPLVAIALMLAAVTAYLYVRNRKHNFRFFPKTTSHNLACVIVSTR